MDNDIANQDTMLENSQFKLALGLSTDLLESLLFTVE